MPQAIKDIVRAPSSYVFRRMFIKRVLGTGGYEANWFEITQYVRQFGTIKESYGDNFYVGEYEIDDLSVQFDNTKSKFNIETDPLSIWNGYATRIGTRFKIEIGFYDVDQEEVLAKSFYGITYSNPEIDGDGNVSFKIASIMKVFQLFSAKGITEQNKFSNIHMDRLVEKEQNGVRIFDRYFEGSNDPTRYQITNGNEKFLIIIEEEQTVWDKIKEFSLYENYFPSITDDGNFQWTNRDETASIQWVFNGAGSFDNEYGINIVSIKQELAVDRTFSRVAIRYDEGSAQVAVSEVNWTPGDLSVPDLYGARPYEYEATHGELNGSIAQSVADRILAQTASPKNIYNIKTTFIPHLKVNDKVTLNYKGSSIPSANSFILGTSIYGGPDVLGTPLGAINLENIDCKISAVSINVDALSCSFELTEI